jgi:thiamine monophosphate synthase
LLDSHNVPDFVALGHYFPGKLEKMRESEGVETEKKNVKLCWLKREVGV